MGRLSGVLERARLLAEKSGALLGVEEGDVAVAVEREGSFLIVTKDGVIIAVTDEGVKVAFGEPVTIYPPRRREDEPSLEELEDLIMG